MLEIIANLFKQNVLDNRTGINKFHFGDAGWYKTHRLAD